MPDTPIADQVDRGQRYERRSLLRWLPTPIKPKRVARLLAVSTLAYRYTRRDEPLVVRVVEYPRLNSALPGYGKPYHASALPSWQPLFSPSFHGGSSRSLSAD